MSILTPKGKRGAVCPVRRVIICCSSKKKFAVSSLQFAVNFFLTPLTANCILQTAYCCYANCQLLLLPFTKETLYE